MRLCVRSFIGVLAALAVLGLTLGTRRRPIQDVGHDWRSLLLGAPPAHR